VVSKVSSLVVSKVSSLVVSLVSSLVVSLVSSKVSSKVSSLVVSKVVIRGSSPVVQISTPALLTRARPDQESSRIFAREMPDKWPLANLRR
jgi:hypothetical protein